MDLKHAVADFLDLYLTIDLPKKEIELIKFRSIQKTATPDPFEHSIICFRKAIALSKKHYLKYRTKSHYGLPESLETLIHLSPEDFFLILAKSRYGLSKDVVSLVLQIPDETALFREKHLKETSKLKETELKSIHQMLQPLEKKTFTQMQKLRGKLRPQRFILESLVTMIAVIMVLWSIPQIKKKYDQWALKKTSEFFVSDSIKDAPIPAELNTKPNIIEPEKTVTLEEPSSNVTKAERKQPKVSEGEVWRFSFTGSPKIDLEKELKTIIEKYSKQPTKASIAPGGIQLDAFIKASDLIEIKMAFENLTDTQNNLLKMSWYKKKNMGTKKIPSAHVEVVIWISTI